MRKAVRLKIKCMFLDLQLLFRTVIFMAQQKTKPNLRLDERQVLMTLWHLTGNLPAVVQYARVKGK